MTQQISKELIEENIKKVENGEALTISLVALNGKFKKKYKEKFGEFEKMDKEERKAYYQKSEVKAYKKVYMKAYGQKPEVKARYKAYGKAYYQKKAKGEK